jgi:hypothetical protein
MASAHMSQGLLELNMFWKIQNVKYKFLSDRMRETCLHGTNIRSMTLC